MPAVPSRKARRAKADASPVHATAMAATGASVVSALCVMTDRSPPDPLNPQTAARMSTAFETWPRYDTERQSLMRAELSRIQSKSGLSRDLGEMVTRMLGA